MKPIHRVFLLVFILLIGFIAGGSTIITTTNIDTNKTTQREECIQQTDEFDLPCVPNSILYRNNYCWCLHPMGKWIKYVFDDEP